MIDVLATLPYWHVPPISIPFPTIPLPGSLPTLHGPINLQPFGILVATGVLVGAHIGRKHAEKLGVDDDLMRYLIGWTVICGFIGAHVFDVFFYQWDEFKHDPVVLIQIWKGISSYGGFLGAVGGYLAFRHRHKVSNDWVMADLAAWSILPGFTFGRAGCATVHDHPGDLSNFFLAVRFPKDSYVSRVYGAGSRHDLGFYELLFLIALNIVFFTVMLKKERRHGYAMAFLAIGYAPVRFLLEPLRLPSTDPRLLGLTPAQWVSIALLATGITMMVKIMKKPEAEAFSMEGIPEGPIDMVKAKQKARASASSKDESAGSDKTSGMKKKKKKKKR